MSNPWIQHVKRFANENNISYACAIPLAKKTYRHNVNQEEESYNYLQNAIYLKNLMKLNERLNEIDKSIKLLTYEKSNVRKRKSSTKQEREEYLKRQIERTKKLQKEERLRQKIDEELDLLILTKNLGNVHNELRQLF